MTSKVLRPLLYDNPKDFKSNVIKSIQKKFYKYIMIPYLYELLHYTLK